MARHDPLRNCRFRLEIDGIQIASFSEVEIGATTTEAIEYREGGDPSNVRKLPGLTKYGNVTLKRGISASLDLYNWHRAMVTGQTLDYRRTVVVVVLDEKGNDAVRFVVADAWPAKYAAGPLNAKGNEVFIELLELVNEGIERTH